MPQDALHLGSKNNISWKQQGTSFSVAMQSSATAEDLPTTSFAGQHESFLNTRSKEDVIQACHDCYISLFNDRADSHPDDYRFLVEEGIDSIAFNPDALILWIQNIAKAEESRLVHQ